MRSILALHLLLAALLWLPAGAAAQTFPSDDAGRPAPWGSYLDTSVTPNQSVVVSTTHPLPISPGSASIGTDTLGYGRSFYFSGSSTTIGIKVALFTDEINVLGWGVAAAQLSVSHSSDGGRTWGPFVSVSFSNTNNPIAAGRTIGTSPRYVLSMQGPATGPRVVTSTSPSGGFADSTFGTGLNVTVPTPATFAIQGSTVMMWTEGVNATNRAVACRSDDNGQTFQNCVVVDVTASSSFSNIGPQAVITSPSVNTWLAVSRQGKVWRSTDNGASWTNVLTLTSLTAAAIKCISATVCLIGDPVGTTIVPRRSTDGGATWTAQSAIGGGPASGSVSAAFCDYGNNVIDLIRRDQFPDTASATTTPAFRSTDGGVTWIGATATGGQAAFLGTNLDTVSDCTATATGRSVFVGFRTASTGIYFGPTTSNTVQLVGSTGFSLNVDSSGNMTANQGLPQTTSPNAWGVVPVQGPSLKNSKQTSAVTTANAITITAVAGQRVHLRKITASCDTAGAMATTLTVTDGATQVWALAATETVLAAVRTTEAWQPSLDSTTGNAMTITLGACTAGTSLLSVQADQF